MASITQHSNGRKTVQFTADSGKRHSIRLGKVSLRLAEQVKLRVEQILVAKSARQPLELDTAQWLGGIDDTLHDRLVRVGLVPSREITSVAALGAFLDDYVTRRIDVREATRVAWGHTVRNLKDFFGDDRDLTSITEADADDFKLHLIGLGLASETIAKRVKNARMFFKLAKKRKLISANPFVEVKAPAVSDPARQHFITVEDTGKLLSVANPTWRIIIGLCRYGGLRCPSEVLSLRWEDVLWDSGKIVVTSPKTSHHEGKGSRVIPLFPELATMLWEAQELADDGEVYVVGGNYREAARGPNGWQNCNLRTQFERIIKRAGLKPWPRLFHNLRASRETELVKEHPIHVVVNWMGNTPKVAMKHYLQVTDADFERATKSGVNFGAVTAPPDQKAVQKSMQSVYAEPRLYSTELIQGNEDLGVVPDDGELCREDAEQEAGPDRTRTCNFYLVRVAL